MPPKCYIRLREVVLDQLVWHTIDRVNATYGVSDLHEPAPESKACLLTQVSISTERGLAPDRRCSCDGRHCPAYQLAPRLQARLRPRRSRGGDRAAVHRRDRPAAGHRLGTGQAAEGHERADVAWMVRAASEYGRVGLNLKPSHRVRVCDHKSLVARFASSLKSLHVNVRAMGFDQATGTC